jgi:hypothetical protein
MPMIFRAIAIFFTLLLAGCGGGKSLTSIQGGESKVFEAPPYVVKGKAPYDQNWIDSQVEGGVAAFGWPRPAPRPPAIDAPRSKQKAAPAKKPAHQSFAKRFKDRVTAPFQASPPVVASPPVIVAPVPAPEPLSPPPKPRDAVDELLDPGEPIRKVH